MPVARRPAAESAEPNHVRPYLFHGVRLTAHGSHGVGTCPFCGKEKFSVAVDTGVWRCLVCGTGTDAGGGNAFTFVRLLHEQSVKATRLDRLIDIAHDRKLLDPATVAAWGVCKSSIDGRTWLVPGYGTDSKLNQLYRREWTNGAWVLKPTPGLWPEGKVHQLHMPVGDFDPVRPKLCVMEGPWDGMALWEVWDRSIADTNIVAVPGCQQWRDDWTAICRGKHITLMYDSDHPVASALAQGRTVRPGFDGMYRVAKKLSGVAASVRWLRWGQEGFDPTKPSGYDVRDFLTGV